MERIESSLFYNQLKKNDMEHSFKDLYQKLNYIWDEYGIPYNKRKKLLLVEIEMVTSSCVMFYQAIIQNKVYGLMMRAKANSIHSSKTKMLMKGERNGTIYKLSVRIIGFGIFILIILA